MPDAPALCDCPVLPVTPLRVGRPCTVCGGRMPPLDEIDHRIMRYEAKPKARIERLRRGLG